MSNNPNSTVTDTTTNNDSSANATKYYLALGDSYTIGQSVNSVERFPEVAVDKLNALSFNFNRPEIIARTGWTTGNLINAIAATPPLRSSYDIVSLLIGVNNQYQSLSQDQYRTEFITLLNDAVKLAGNRPERVFVLSIPDYSVTPFATGSNKALIAAEIDSFNKINLSASQSGGVHYLNITSLTRQAATDATLIATDGLHPSGKEYARWVEELVPLIKPALK